MLHVRICAGGAGQPASLPRQSIETTLKMSETRERLNIINALPEADVTDAIRAEEGTLAAKLPALEREYREALTAEADKRAHPTIDAETRERLELRSRARVGDVLAAFIDGGPVDGATAEYRSAMGLSWYEIPLDLFEPLAGRPVETRAVTPAPTDSPIEVSPVQPFVYARTQAAYMGVDIVTVGSARMRSRRSLRARLPVQRPRAWRRMRPPR